LILLPFQVHQFYLKETEMYYLPLPKLSGAQMQFIAERLEGGGFSVRMTNRLHARTETKRITLDPSGLAWSSGEVLDAIAPAIPPILGFAKEHAASNPYFAQKKTDEGSEIHLFPRMESSRLWSALRESGESGLTPDEKLAVQGLLEAANGEIECVTDYPTEGCRPLQVGSARYYMSKLGAQEFASSLRTISSSSYRNSYLPRDSILKIEGRSLDWDFLSRDLGEWCYLDFPPKTSNSGARGGRPTPR
jgi:hypothetical protein